VIGLPLQDALMEGHCDEHATVLSQREINQQI
jgi:hypothetical protein